MKRLFVYSALMALCSLVVFAAQQTWTGQISDAMCKSDHGMMQKGAMKMSDKECAMACAKSGQKYVLVSGGKVFQIEYAQNHGFLRFRQIPGKTAGADHMLELFRRVPASAMGAFPSQRAREGFR